MKELGTLRISGTNWKVIVASVDEVPELKGCEAVTLPKLRLIAIDKTVSENKSACRLALVHEILHAAFSCHKFERLQKTVFRCKDEDVLKIEEEIVILLSIFLTDATFDGKRIIKV